jgi:hypothetical protein
VAILYNGSVRARGTITELLEARDRIRFTVPDLDADTTDAIAQWLETRTGAAPAVDRPAMNLEQLFLDVVEQAGTARGQPIASFLANSGPEE